MKLEPYKEASIIWKKAAGNSTPQKLNFEIELYKKLLNFFHVGDYYYLIFNYPTNSADFVSHEVEKMLGCPAEMYSIPFVLSIVHPNDIAYLLNFENKAIEFLTTLPVDKLMKYKIRYDYRIRKSNGDYIRVLQQAVVLEHDENGGLLKTLVIHTDITELKSEGKPVLSFIGLEGEPSYINVDFEKIIKTSKDFLTKREKQILSLLIDGKLSKEISGILNISKHTVDKHRKNMLYKNKLNNMGELIAKAVKQGWL